MSADIEVRDPSTDGLNLAPARDIIDNPHSTTMQEISDAIGVAGGPISFSEYMTIVHYGQDGYYSRGKADIRSKIGGDFLTAPAEMTDFCEGITYAQYKIWVGLGRPSVVHVIEQGAGNGLMAKDTLSFARHELPDFYDALNYHIVEYGDMALKQRRTILGQNDPQTTPRRGSIAEESTPEEHREDLRKVRWHREDAITSEVAYDGGIYVVNELADDFPVEVVRCKNGQYEQKFIGLDSNGALEEVWLPLSAGTANYIEQYSIQVSEGQEAAINLNTAAWQSKMNRILRERSGALINTDYGFPSAKSMHRAVRTYPPRHRVLHAPGELNLTSDVDFGMLAKLAMRDDIEVAFSGTQTELLRRLGVPTAQEVAHLDVITEMSQRVPLSNAELIRKHAVQTWMRGGNMFHGLVLTSGVSVDFRTTEPLRAPFDKLLPPRSEVRATSSEAAGGDSITRAIHDVIDTL
jgi:SAM-dependent MidA family methyltransferase